MFRSVRGKYSSVRILIPFLLVGLSVLACDGTPSQGIQSQALPSKKPQSQVIIGVVNTAPSFDLRLEGFKDSMTELGYVEGNNVVYVYSGPVGSNVNEIGPAVRNLVESGVNLILSLGTPATVVVKEVTAGTGIPVVFFVSNPVAAGIVENLRHPGGNMTGTRREPADGRRLELLLQVAPFVRRIYIPYNPDDPAPADALVGVNEAAAKLGVELVLREARNDGEVVAAVGGIPGDVNAIYLLPDALLNGHITEWVDAAFKRGLPLSGPNRDHVQTGALITYGVDLYEGGALSARLADEILRGANPGDLPIEPEPPLLVINLKTAGVIGVDVPDEILRQADDIVRE